MLAGDVAHQNALLPVHDEREHAVIRRQKIMARGGDQQGAARGAHAGIHHDDVRRVRRIVAIGLRQSQGGIQHIEGIHRVAQVHHVGLQVDAKDDAAHGAHEVIRDAEIRCQGDNVVCRHSGLPAVCRSQPHRQFLHEWGGAAMCKPCTRRDARIQFYTFRAGAATKCSPLS